MLEVDHAYFRLWFAANHDVPVSEPVTLTDTSCEDELCDDGLADSVGAFLSIHVNVIVFAPPEFPATSISLAYIVVLSERTSGAV